MACHQPQGWATRLPPLPPPAATAHLQLRLQRRQLVALWPRGALQLGNARLQRVGVALLEWIGDDVWFQLLAVGAKLLYQPALPRWESNATPLVAMQNLVAQAATEGTDTGAQPRHVHLP